MPETLNLNLDSKSLESCLKSVSNIGSTQYVNICTGQTNTVPWGSADYLFLIITIAFVATFIGILGSMFWKIIFD